MGGAVTEGHMWPHFLAGELGGMAGVLVSHPFDTLKTRMQHGHFKNMRACAHHIVSANGGNPLGLYRGILSPFFGQGLMFSIAFGVKGACADALRQSRGGAPLSLVDVTGCGAVAGFVNAFFRGPMERLKCWSQVHNIPTPTAVRQLYSRYGVRRGMFQGLGATVLREVPQFGSYYPAYEFMVRFLAPNCQDRSQLSTSVILGAGATAGVTQWVVTYPIDTMKTLIQSSETPLTLREAYRLVGAKGGLRAFWTGFTPTVLRAVPMHAAVFFIYEWTIKTVEAST